MGQFCVVYDKVLVYWRMNMNITQRFKKTRMNTGNTGRHMNITQSKNRLLSLDVMRGLVMVLLAGESCLLYLSLHDLQPNGTSAHLVDQLFHHHPWNGLHLWDLIQPGFILMSGSDMYISYHNKLAKGIIWGKNFKHVAIRCAKLFLLGVMIHCVDKGKLVWELWNVLTQLSVTTLIAYLIIRRSNTFQIIFSLVLLIITEVLYRYVWIQGYDQPFLIGKNFGSYVDMLLMGKTNPYGWVAINVIPTAAHTIWGVLTGKLLISQTSASHKIKVLLLAGICGLIIGYGLDIASITPIIKRISTSSFVL